MHSYSKDGAMRVRNVFDPVYVPNSRGGRADGERFPDTAIWEDGEFIRAPHALRKGDGDYGQAGALVREVMDDRQHDRLVSNVVGHLKGGVSDAVLECAFQYWRNIDRKIGDRIAKGVKGN